MEARPLKTFPLEGEVGTAFEKTQGSMRVMLCFKANAQNVSAPPQTFCLLAKAQLPPQGGALLKVRERFKLAILENSP